LRTTKAEYLHISGIEVYTAGSSTVKTGGSSGESVEECSGKKCAGYRGNQNKTKGGFTCMKWTS